MNDRPDPPAARSLRAGIALALGITLASTPAFAQQGAGSAAALRAAYAAQRADGQRGPFGEPVAMRSEHQGDRLHGDVASALPHPFATVRDALDDPKSWCEILILHPNVRHCAVGGAEAAGAQRATLSVQLGNANTPASFDYRVVAVRADYLAVRLTAPEGPLGTRDYDIVLEAAPLDDRRTVVHLAYAHAYGMRAKMAMQAYFGTVGRDKVGFTVVGRDAQGAPIHVGEFRGALERNAMRYYLAIEAYLETRAAPASERVERAARRWLEYAERYPRQLHEEPGYLEAKLRDVRRQTLAQSDAR